MYRTPLLFFLVARVTLSLASTILSVTVGWHIYEATGDPFNLALVGLVQVIPIAGLFIVTGWVVDHFPRKLILLCCAALQASVFLGIALSISEGTINLTVIFSLLFLNGCVRAFFGPAVQAFLPNIVKPKKLAGAVAVVSTAWTTAMTVAPFAAGLLISSINFYTYWLLVCLALITFIAILPLPNFKAVSSTERGTKQLLEGVHFVLKNPIVLPSITLDMIIVLLGSVVALLPVYAIDVLGVGPTELGALRAMPALGSVMMGTLMSRLPRMRYSGRILFASLAVFSISILVFGLSKYFWLSLTALWVYGASDMVSVNVRSTLIHLATPDQLRGRVSAVNSLFVATSNDLGDFRAGSVATAIGPVAAVVAGSFMAFAATVIGYKMSTRLKTLDRLDDARIRSD